MSNYDNDFKGGELPRTLIDVVQTRAKEQPDLRTYTFLGDGESEDGHLTAAQLEKESRAIGAYLMEQGLKDERALMLYLSGLEYISAFYGCLFGGVVAVPAYPPDPSRLNRTMPRLIAIIKDAGCKVILTTSMIKMMTEGMLAEFPELAGLTWIATDEIDPSYADKYERPPIDSDSLAFLQYTSGSTGNPKGVMLSHGNLIHNVQVAASRANITKKSIAVCWLPNFHDMGLIWGIIHPTYVGFPTYIMPPLSFLQRPYRWLKAISKYKATDTGGPNFAYDLASRKITPEQRKELDLSSWRLAFSGAEPIRPDTFQRFAETFAECGFDGLALSPAYGLAESAVYVASGWAEKPITVIEIDTKKMEEGIVELAEPGTGREIISIGDSTPGTPVIIVDPVTMATLPEGRVGEMWTRGRSVSKGYWARPDATAETFHGYTSDTKEGPFLRTGDLGFRFQGRLYISGREKDLIIIRGRNHYPQDIELTTEEAHPRVRKGCVACFSLEVNDEEELVVVTEVDARGDDFDADEVMNAIRRKVVDGHDLVPYDVVLIKAKSITKTSSGKIQRRACKIEYQGDILEVVARLAGRPTSIDDTPEAPVAQDNRRRRASPAAMEMERWLAKQLAPHVKKPANAIDTQTQFSHFGLDSKALVGISGDLEEGLKRKLPPSVLYDYPTIAALAAHLVGEDDASESRSGRRFITPADEPIAVIGVGCRYPGGVQSPETFWELLEEGRDGIVEIPEGRWDVDALFDPTPRTPGKMYTRRGGFLEDVDKFDPGFFGISPREAEAMDPQQRLLLEVTWEALEHAGLPAEALEGSRTGVYVGICATDYAQGSIFSGDPLKVDGYAATGNALSVAAGRISYLLGLQGPALSVDTACSSSLVTVHLAAQSLLSGESDVAVAGGVNLILSPSGTIYFSQLQAMAADGHCKTFDKGADGYVRSEGCGMVVLKRLSDAQADGDNILGLIRGSAINQDGRSNGLTAPNGPSQQAVIEEAMAVAGITPDEVQYIEAHGTGTPLGDPIEMKAIGGALSLGRGDDNKVLVGSVKTNFGHTEGAAGVAGLIKTLLSLGHERIPKNLHFHTPSEQIPWDDIPVAVASEPTPWPAEGPRRLAGISSFGFSGTNAHVIVEEAPRPESPENPENNDDGASAKAEPSAVPLLLPLTAPTPKGIRAQAQAMGAFLEGVDGTRQLHDIAFTTSTRRSHHAYRLAAVGDNAASLSKALMAYAKDGEHPSVRAGRRGAQAPRVVFVFPGQGSQWLSMGQGLMESNAAFRDTMIDCDAAITRALPEGSNWSLMGELAKTEDPLYLTRIDVIQPTLWAINVSLAAMWRSWGVEPDAVVGHSMGEVAAAAVAGALSLEDAAKIICRRSHLMRRVSGQGVMAVIGMGKADAEELIKDVQDKVSVAVSNSPTSTVLSGDPDTIEAIMAKLEAKETFCRLIKVDVASHSPQMDPLKEDLLAAIEGITPKVGTVPIYSTVLAKVIDGHEMDENYWVANLRTPVQFGTAMSQLIEAGHTLFIESSPHPVLQSVVAQTLQESGDESAKVAVPSLRREQDEMRAMLDSLGDLYTHGLDPAWGAIAPAGSPTALPAYPWQRESYWIDPNPTQSGAGRLGAGGHPLLGGAFSSSVHAGTRFWEAPVSGEALPWLKDHKVQEAIVFPAAGYVELLSAAARGAGATGTLEIKDLRFRDALAFPGGEGRNLQIVLRDGGAGDFSAQVSSQGAGEDGWQLHGTGSVRSLAEDSAAKIIDVPALTKAMGEEEAPEAHYERVGSAGLNYGPAFQGVQGIRSAKGQALGRVTLPEAAGSSRGYGVHPALLDACFQVMASALAAGDGDSGPAVPVAIESVVIRGIPTGEVYSLVTLTEEDDAKGEVSADIEIIDGDGALVITIRGLTAKRLDASAGGAEDKEEIFLAVEWDLAEAPAAGSAQGSWLLIGDGQGLGDGLEAALKGKGQGVVRASLKGEAGSGTSLDPRDAEAFKAFLKSSFGESTPCAGIVHLAGLRASGGDMQDAMRADLYSALHLIQGIVAQQWRNPPRLALVTRGTQAVNSGDNAISLAQSPLWGLGGTITSEHAELSPTRIDLPNTPIEGEADGLAAELLAKNHEEQVALRAEGRYVARLRRQSALADSTEVMGPAEGRPYRLEIDNPGSLESLTLRHSPRKVPGAGQVEIEVSASGLNFRDVMMAMGIYDFHGEEVRLGGECAGTVVGLGFGVEGLALGDEVIAITPHTFSSHVIAEASHLVKKPASLSAGEAAGMPSVFTTAWYALYDLARLTEGESILIHSATGGTGLAAIQLAQRVGARVFATAGSEEKRQYLRDMGIEHVYDSRSTDFGGQIMADTKGRGVDVVLNSLAGSAIEAGLACLAPDGRFLELGKRDIYADRPIGLAAFAKRITYTAIDLASYAEDRPERFRQLLVTVADAFEKGELKALPTKEYAIDDAQEMFHFMARAQHVGKLVATFGDNPTIALPAGDGFEFTAEGTYLITGGLGGLGLSAAHWMATQGAKHLALMGRRGAASDAQKAAVAGLEAAGATVHILKADVSDKAQVKAALEGLRASAPPLKGVIHAAGVLSDALLLQQDINHFEAVMAPKIAGAINLHELTQGDPLDLFVLYSSAAALFGSPGQGNYAAANAFLDALATDRALKGAPGLSINWGAFSEVGLAAAQENRAGRLDNRGMRSITPDEGNQILGQLLQGAPAQVGVVPLNVRQWVEFYPQAAASSLLSDLVASASVAPRTGDEALKAALDEAEGQGRVEVMEGFLRGQVAKVLRVDPERIERDTPLKSLGIDSLMGMELRNGLEGGLGLALSATLIWTYPTISALSAYLLEQLGYGDVEAEKAAALKAQQEAEAEAKAREEEAEIDALSDEELAAFGDDFLD